LSADAARVDVDRVMTELHGRVRERLRAQVAEGRDPHAFDDPALFAEVESLLRAAAGTSETSTLILPKLLGEPHTWRLSTTMRYTSHRGTGPASILTFVKQRLLMPVLRWLFEYSRDNFERQRRVNHVLFACIQELAVETALLRRELRHPSGDTSPPPGPSTSSPHSPGR
jgi:hypothetical protein